MRIVGGNSKGRRLRVSKTGQRPTKAIVREAIFNILRDHIVDSQVLDIFAGSGALGLEALSRGAHHCTFIERSARVLKYNIRQLLYEKKTAVIVADYRAGIKKLRGNNYDIIFLDPPYHGRYMTKTIHLINTLRLLDQNGWVVAEHDSDEIFDTPTSMAIAKKHEYGDTAISFICYK